jgi:hypothetical protein
MRCFGVQQGTPLLPIIAWVLLLLASPIVGAENGDSDPPEVAIGERLFLETRFAQFFFSQSKGDANHTLEVGDPVVDVIETLDAPLPGPFAGQAINCRACHLVDEQGGIAEGSNRTYADFARRSPLPARDDGLTHAPRNAPPLVNAFLAKLHALLLHFDGEFATVQDLHRSAVSRDPGSGGDRKLHRLPCPTSFYRLSLPQHRGLPG